MTEGFKGVVLGATSGQIGSFQPTKQPLSSLGGDVILKGDLTLGMLIAFRIISGNVTGPLLQLSSLYQGFQKVQVSMERLSDILDQNPNWPVKMIKIKLLCLPSKEYRFEDVRFRFGSKGPYQVNNVSLRIDEGSFVGIVGQSGSGKSTLTKLCPVFMHQMLAAFLLTIMISVKLIYQVFGVKLELFQDSLLFEGSIAENIALNDPQA